MQFIEQDKIIKKYLKYICLVAIFSLIIILVLAGIYYYFTTFRNRELYPNTSPNIDQDRLESLNFKEIRYQGTSAFYVPERWVLLDKNLNSYGDVLNGSLAYLRAYPNSFGILSDSVCRELTSQANERFKSERLYLSSNLINSKISKQKNYSGCLMEFDSIIAGKEFRIKQFYVFQKYNIYQVFIQTRKDLASENEVSNVVLDSISLSN